MNNERTRLTDEYLEECIKVLTSVIGVCENTKNTGVSFNSACDSYGLDALKVRAMLLSSLPKFSSVKVPAESVLDDIYDNYEKFYHAVLGRMDIEIPYDYKEAVEMVLCELDEKQRDVIRRHFGLRPYDEMMTLDNIGEIFGVSRERVRMLEAKGIRRCRHKDCQQILLYGAEKYAFTEKQKKEKHDMEIASVKAEHEAFMEKLKKERENMTSGERVFRHELERVSVSELTFSVRGDNALRRAGVKNVYTLIMLTDDALSYVRNTGKMTQEYIVNVLSKWISERYGITLRDMKKYLLEETAPIDEQEFRKICEETEIQDVKTEMSRDVLDKFRSEGIVTVGDLFRLTDSHAWRLFCMWEPSRHQTWMINELHMIRAMFAISHGMTETMASDIYRRKEQ